ncbi:MAG: RadC family protein [Lachnospiraceae bacterium]|jgi:DNA repair protein RadC
MDKEYRTEEKEHLQVKELPAELRPYERCRKEGPGVLNDAELLAVILRTGNVGETSVELAQRLLRGRSVSDLVSMTFSQLTSVKGIGKVKAVQIQCLGELAHRISSRAKPERPVLDSPARIADRYMDRLCRETREKVIVAFLNQKCRLVGETVLTEGTVNSSLISVREVFVEALRHDAVAVILIHNHPSGDPEPSAEDLSVTKKTAGAGKLIGIRLLDHIIIGDHVYCSLRERGLVDEQ